MLLTYQDSFIKIKDHFKEEKGLSLVTCDNSLAIWSNEYVDYVLEEFEFGCTFMKRNIELMMFKVWLIPMDEHFDELIKILEK